MHKGNDAFIKPGDLVIVFASRDKTPMPLTVTPGEHVFGRVDVGARMVRYPGPSIDGQRRVHDGAFRATDPRLAVSAGVRF
mgnify:CR=1 FL=1